MPAAVRLGDICTGHGSYAPRVCDTASPNVFINNMGAHRVGDHWIEHCSGKCHDSRQATGSSSVFVNNKAMARLGDQIACGSMNAQGSPNVFANEGRSRVKQGFSGAGFAKQFADKSDLDPTY
jgi:uncharacterized Zn-binding protein involved in type VI secretion